MTIRPIRNKEDLRLSKTRLALLLSKPATSRQEDDEMEVLATLVQHFEEQNTPVPSPDSIAAIRFRMDERGMNPRQLEPFVGSRARVSEVLSGKRQLSIDMIRSLHEGLGIPYESLISNRQNNEELHHVSDTAVERLNTFGFNLRPNDVSNFIASSLGQGASLALLRKTRTQRAASKTDQGSLLLWQAAILKRCEAAPPSTIFNAANFTPNDLRQIARMSSREDGPCRAIRELTSRGICVASIPSLPGTFLDGAAMVTSSGVPVVALTLRYDRVDNFWFTLLHELSHICLHFAVLLETRTAFVDDMEIQSEDIYEQEADALARDSLIPSEILTQVVWNDTSSQDNLVTVATRARVNISVVAGRWQREHQNYKKFSRLIDRNSIRSLLYEHCKEMVW